VVRGAAIFGIEKESMSDVVRLKACPSNYGLLVNEPFSESKSDKQDYYVDRLTKAQMAAQQLIWPIKRGDLVLPGDPNISETPFSFKFTSSDPSRWRCQLDIYEYSDEDDDLPSRMKGRGDGK
jgi:hypothetical protein